MDYLPCNFITTAVFLWHLRQIQFIDRRLHLIQLIILQVWNFHSIPIFFPSISTVPWIVILMELLIETPTKPIWETPSHFQEFHLSSRILDFMVQRLDNSQFLVNLDKLYESNIVNGAVSIQFKRCMYWNCCLYSFNQTMVMYTLENRLRWRKIPKPWFHNVSSVHRERLRQTVYRPWSMQHAAIFFRKECRKF